MQGGIIMKLSKLVTVFLILVTVFTLVMPNAAANAVSSEVTHNAPPIPSLVPVAPSELKAVFTEKKITLSWKDNSSNETGFEISTYCSGIGGGTLKVPANTTSYVLTTNIYSNADYSFEVRSYNAFGNSTWSNEVNLTVPANYPPAAPTDLTGTYANGKVTLTWKDNSSVETGFRIAEASPSTAARAINVSANTQSYIETDTLKPGEEYTFSVYAYNSYGNSPVSNVIKVQIPIVYIFPPAAPSDLTVTLSGNTAILSWKDNSSNETGFEIAGSDSSGSGGTLNAAANATVYVDTGLVQGRTYTYKVCAKNALGKSAYSNQVSITVPIGGPGGLVFDGTQSKWAEEELKQAFNYNLTYPDIMNNYQRNITRQEFAHIAVKLYEKLSGRQALVSIVNPFDDTQDIEVRKAYELGIVKGVGGNSFAPYNSITRQEICAMICRTLKAAKPNLQMDTTGVGPFADEDKISKWAINDVRFASKHGIMKGVGGNNINPFGNTSREQAIALIKRTYDSFK